MIMCKINCSGGCKDCSPEDHKQKPHKHATLIKAWADNPHLELQFRGGGLKSSCWFPMRTPDWSHSEVRIKPTPKPDVVIYSYLETSGTYRSNKKKRPVHNIE